MALDPNGTASCTLPSLPVGEHEVVATYAGSGPFGASADTTTHCVVRARPQLVARPYVCSGGGLIVAIVVPEVSATLTVGGAPVAGAPIQFSSQAGALCSAVTNANGVARCSPGLLVGLGALFRNGYTARFAGDGNVEPASDTAPLFA